jgi:hypothetical protein
MPSAESQAAGETPLDDAGILRIVIPVAGAAS